MASYEREGEMAHIYGEKGNTVAQSQSEVVDLAVEAEATREIVFERIKTDLKLAEENLKALAAQREQKEAEWSRCEQALRHIVDAIRHGLDSPPQTNSAPDW